MTIGILAVTLAAKFNRTEIGSAVAADMIIADVRHVQLKAISVGQPCKIVFSGNIYTMSRTRDTFEIEIETKTLPNDETATPNFGNTLMFNSLGEPHNASSAFPTPYGQIQLSGGSKIKIYDITGKAEVE